MIQMKFLFCLNGIALENAQKFAQSDIIKEAMKNAGVVGMPEIYFLEEAAKTAK